MAFSIDSSLSNSASFAGAAETRCILAVTVDVGCEEDPADVSSSSRTVDPTGGWALLYLPRTPRVPGCHATMRLTLRARTAMTIIPAEAVARCAAKAVDRQGLQQRDQGRASAR